MADFIGLLRLHGIGAIVDVRSSPYAGYTPHFNRSALEAHMKTERIRYVFLGDVLGGRPEPDRFYDAEGHVLYGEVAVWERFRRGIERLLRGARSYRVALLCSEEDPTDCHRHLLIGRVLAESGIDVRHIRADGAVQTQAEVSEAAQLAITGAQPRLFDQQEPEQWRSTRSVTRRGRPASSSRPSSAIG
jgi:uncharacterized protein (DUF488 family)